MRRHVRRFPTELKLGSAYKLRWKNSWWLGDMNCIFIQPTKCGFNFLNLETHKCVLPHHLYPSKKDGKFWVNENLIIWHIIQEKSRKAYIG